MIVEAKNNKNGEFYESPETYSVFYEVPKQGDTDETDSGLATAF